MEPDGGVGKSTVTALLGLALRDMGQKVGFLDIDLSGSTLHKALGLSEPPRTKTSTALRKLIPPEIDGYYLFSICAHFGEANSVMWKGETGTVEIPDEVMGKIQAWLKVNQDIVQRSNQFLAENPDLRSSFKVVREADVSASAVVLKTNVCFQQGRNHPSTLISAGAVAR